MPRRIEQLIENSFNKGLITEATGMNFPEHAAVEMWDCFITSKSSVKRRPGFEYEADYEFDNYDREASVTSTYLWRSVAGDPDVSFVVLQVGPTLYYYSISSGGVSPNKETFTTDLDAKKISGASSLQVSSNQCDFTQVDGRLYVAHPFMDPFYVEYNSSGPSISETTITVLIRDLEGSPDDPYKVDQRPVATVDSVDINHLYNLTNQGWANKVKENGGTTVYPLSDWDAARGDLPSNTDRWWMFKDSTNEFDTGRISEVQWSTGVAAKGFYILNAFNSNRNSAVNSEFATLDVAYSLTGETQAAGDITEFSAGINRPRAITSFAGRIFYAGVDSTSFNNKIYFSQVLIDKARSGLCYQKNDPTDENFSDLVADDGGVIVIPEITTIYKIFALRNSVVVFASNGVWSIQGSEGIGFSATDYSVEKISSEGAISRASFVNAEGIPLWWNWNGIFTISQDTTGLGSSGVKNLTKETIQTFYNAIPGENKLYASGAYDPVEKRIYWVFASEAASSVSDRFVFDRVLVFDLLKQAFYPWTIDTTVGVNVQNILMVEGLVATGDVSEVIDSSLDTVIDSSSDTVVVDNNTTEQLSPIIKYVVSKQVSGTTYAFTFADLSDEDNFVDWLTEEGSTGVAYTSYFITGYALPGGALAEVQNNYINVLSQTSTGSSILFSTLWDYVNTTSDKRWTGNQQAYKHDANHNVSIRRLKVRGKGQALQIKMQSEGSSPFEVLGWSTKILVDAAP